ncbi:hypothetical protein CUZ91_0454 [Enterococcus xinjiangensis]|nr:hypothetical protein [Enterococcus lactis]
MNTTTKAYNFKSFLEKDRYLLDSWSFFIFSIYKAITLFYNFVNQIKILS